MPTQIVCQMIAGDEVQGSTTFLNDQLLFSHVFLIINFHLVSPEQLNQSYNRYQAEIKQQEEVKAATEMQLLARQEMFWPFRDVKM